MADKKYHIEIRICPITHNEAGEAEINTLLNPVSILSQGEGWNQEEVLQLAEDLKDSLNTYSDTPCVQSLWDENPLPNF